VKLTIF